MNWFSGVCTPQYLGGFDPHTIGKLSADKKFPIWGRPSDDTSVHFEVQPIFIYIYILHSQILIWLQVKFQCPTWVSSQEVSSVAPGLNLDALLTGRGNPTVRVRGSESNFWEHIKASKTEYTKRPKQCLGGILRFVGNPCEIVMCDMLCALFDVTYIYIYKYICGRASKCKTSIHTLDPQAIHSPDPYPWSYISKGSDPSP